MSNSRRRLIAPALPEFWFAENAFARGILPVAAACAVATRRVIINAGVFNPFTRHPTMMAMEISALDELTNGRSSLSVGSGIASATERLGLNVSKPLPGLRDTLMIVRGLLRGEEVDHQGTAFSARKVKLDYALRAEIPIYLAGRGDLTVQLAGDLADGFLVSNMCSTALAARLAGLMQDRRRAVGRMGAGAVVRYMPCAVNHDLKVALAAGKRAVGAMLPVFWALGQKVQSAKEALLVGTGIEELEFATAAARLRAGEDAVDVLDERMARAFALVGTPEQCLEEAARYAQAGITELALTFGGAAARQEIEALGAAIGND